MTDHKDNQQESPTEQEIAWLAGVIECDGTVMMSCYIRNEKANPKMGTQITIYNTDGGIVSKVVDILERLKLSHYITERRQTPMKMDSGKSYGNNKIMLSVNVKNIGDAYILGKLIRPWMFGEKGHRLDLVIQYLARRIEKIKESGPTAPLDRGDCQLVQDYYKRFVKRKGHNRHLVDALLNDFA